MFPFWLTIIFACAGILGLYFLIRSVSKMIALYNSPYSREFSALLPSSAFDIQKSGMYEIAVKRPSLFGIIPSGVAFQLLDLNSNTEVRVNQTVNFFSQRKNMSGERIVPVAEFNAAHTGNYQFTNPATEKFKEGDKILITPKTGMKGFLLIFAILFSAIFFIGGTVLTILSFVKK